MPLAAFWMTCAVEVPIVLVALKRFGWLPGAGWGRALAVAAAVQVTQPVVWLVGSRDWSALLAAEAVAWLVEGLGLWALLHPRAGGGRIGDAMAAAIVANAAAFALGLAFPHLVGG
ncbi:MAG: hypothetical protein R2731_02500 [Nocardioides sp.]